MTNQTRSVAWKNTYIAQEWGKNGQLSDNTEYTRSRRPHFTKAKTDETRAKEAAEKRYVRRSNTCPKCHMLMAVGTGTCDCS